MMRLDLSDQLRMLRALWSSIRGVPGGKRLYGGLLGVFAPYSGSIAARIVGLSEGYAELRMSDRRRLRNHLGSIHAIALANLGELTASIALGHSIPDGTRFIPAGLEIEYVKKARGPITSYCEWLPRSCEGPQVLVPVTLRDQSGDEVARVTLRAKIGPLGRRRRVGAA